MYAIVPTDSLEAYIDTHGDLGQALSRHEHLEDARDRAESIAMDYHYGVELVDEQSWEVV